MRDRRGIGVLQAGDILFVVVVEADETDAPTFVFRQAFNGASAMSMYPLMA